MNGFEDGARSRPGRSVGVGESFLMSGENASRSEIRLPGDRVQEQLVESILSAGRPVMAIINAGRPLLFPTLFSGARAILYTWFLGSEAGNAKADELFGVESPPSKLPMSFSRVERLISIFYKHKSTAVPSQSQQCIDLAAGAAYPFGFGLSYTIFEYTDLTLERT